MPGVGRYSAHVTCVNSRARLTFLGGEGHAMWDKNGAVA